MKYLLLLLLSTAAFAKDPGFGAVVGDHDGLAIGDFNLFHHDEESYGFTRYGGAFNRLQVGDGLGISLSDQVGFMLHEEGFVVGIEPAGGKAVAHTQSQSFYEWTPMVSVGPHFEGFFSSLIILAKAGGGVGTLGYDGLAPHAHGAYGYAAYLDTPLLGFGYDAINVDDASINNFDIQVENLAIRWEHTKGLKDESSWAGLIRWVF